MPRGLPQREHGASRITRDGHPAVRPHVERGRHERAARGTDAGGRVISVRDSDVTEPMSRDITRALVGAQVVDAAYIAPRLAHDGVALVGSDREFLSGPAEELFVEAPCRALVRRSELHPAERPWRVRCDFHGSLRA